MWKLECCVVSREQHQRVERAQNVADERLRGQAVAAAAECKVKLRRAIRSRLHKYVGREPCMLAPSK